MTDALDDARAAFQRTVLDRNGALGALVLDDDFQLLVLQPAPATMPRQRWLEVLPDYVVHSYTVEHETVDEDGDTAAAFSLVRMEATVLGQDRSGLFVLSDIWRRRGDEWRIWRRHSTPATAGPLPGT